MRAEIAVLCRDIVGRSLPADLHGAGLDELWLSKLPVEVRLFLALSLRGPAEEFTESVEHRVEVYLVGPGPRGLGDLDFVFTGADVGEGGIEARVFHRLALEFEVEEYGPHIVEVYVDGERLASLPLHVREP